MRRKDEFLEDVMQVKLEGNAFEKSQVVFLKKWPSVKKINQSLGCTPDAMLVIYDRKIEKRPEGADWLKTFNYTYAVTAGEKLKDLDSFPGHMKKIMRLLGPVSPQSFCIVAVGGGTVGDFAGFIASVFKRGVSLVHIPTTLLAAIDSAHGGKTALNVGDFKNQIGSFYPASAVMIVRSILQGLPVSLVHASVGELCKMALIEGGEFYSQIQKEYMTGFDLVWNFLPQAIESKYKIIDKDPWEKTGERQVLNLGHSLGHVLESHYDVAHGMAVGLGLVFSIRWSHHRGFLKLESMEDILTFLHDKMGVQRPEDFFQRHRKMSRGRLEKILEQDKKMVDKTHIRFIFIDGPGGAFGKSVTVDSFLTEAQRQGWVV